MAPGRVMALLPFAVPAASVTRDAAPANATRRVVVWRTPVFRRLVATLPAR